MKKLFVSVPMQGRTEEEIRASIAKMKTIAEAYEGEKLELIDTYMTEEPSMDCNKSLWYLSKSLEKLAITDIFIGIEDVFHWRGCKIETDAAKLYGIKSYKVAPDIVIPNYEVVKALQSAFKN